jgi:hypothetical protein
MEYIAGARRFCAITEAVGVARRLRQVCRSVVRRVQVYGCWLQSRRRRGQHLPCQGRASGPQLSIAYIPSSAC